MSPRFLRRVGVHRNREDLRRRVDQGRRKRAIQLGHRRCDSVWVYLDTLEDVGDQDQRNPRLWKRREAEKLVSHGYGWTSFRLVAEVRDSMT